MCLRIDASCFGYDFVSKNYLPVLVFSLIWVFTEHFFWLVFACYTEGNRFLFLLCATHLTTQTSVLHRGRVLLDMVKYLLDFVTCSKECHSTHSLRFNVGLISWAKVTSMVEVNTKCCQQTMHTLLPLKGCIHSPNGGSVIHVGWKLVLICLVARRKCQMGFILCQLHNIISWET